MELNLGGVSLLCGETRKFCMVVGKFSKVLSHPCFYCTDISTTPIK